MRTAGDLEAFCRREYPRLVGSLSLHCGDAGAAEDLAQEALARAVDRWERVGRMEAPGAWVHRVAINLASSHYRRRQAERRARARHGAAVDRDDVDLAGALAVRQAVRRLPDRQRTALVLRFFLQMSVAETAAVMGCSEGAVTQHTRRGVAALRARFQPRESQHG